MKFNKWIKAQGGAIGVARLLGTERAVVHAWMAGVCCPKADTMQELVKIGRGSFSYDDIINEARILKKKRQGKGGAKGAA